VLTELSTTELLSATTLAAPWDAAAAAAFCAEYRPKAELAPSAALKGFGARFAADAYPTWTEILSGKRIGPPAHGFGTRLKLVKVKVVAVAAAILLDPLARAFG